MNNRTIVLIHACLIIAAVAISFYPVISNGYISLDDNVMLVQNEKVFELSIAGIEKYFSGIHWGLYHPLVLLSYALEFKFFKLDPVVYHTTNLYLHLFNCLLVYWLFLLLTEKNWKAFIAALFFAVHPLHVESVAWVTERKDVLYAFFYLGAAVSYKYYLKKDKRIWYYGITLLLFILSLLSKPMAISLPLLLLLFDLMVTGRVSVRDLKEKAAFFLVAAVFGVLAIAGQKPFQGAGGSFFINFVSHCFEANYAAMLYFYKIFYPVKYSICYSYFIEGRNLIKGYLWYSPLPSSLLVAAIVYSLKYTKKLLYGALFFGITLLPASNLIQFGVGLPGDRFMYIPSLGFFYVFAESVLWFLEKMKKNKAVFISAIAAFLLIVAALGVITNNRCRLWKDTFSLYSDIIKSYPDVPNSKSIYTVLAFCCLEKGDMENAIKFNNKSHELDARYSGYSYFKSQLAYNKKDYKEALIFIDEAMSLDRKSSIYVLKAKILCGMKKYDLALSCADKLTAKKEYASKGYALEGEIYLGMKDFRKAVAACSRALEINSFNSEAYITRGVSYKNIGETARSAADFKKAAEIEANNTVVKIRQAPTL